MPTCSAGLSTGETGHRLEQGLQRMEWGHVDGKSAGPEFLVTLRVFDRGCEENLNPAVLFALRLTKPIETIYKPAVGRQDVAVRNHVGEFTTISENTHKEIMLASLSAGELAEAACAKSPKSNPVAPGQFRPRGPAFIPMQDDRVVVRGSSHGHLPASRYDNTSTPAGGSYRPMRQTAGFIPGGS